MLTNGVKGALWMLATVASFVGMAVAGRELSADMSTAGVMFWRGLVGLAMVTPVALWRGGLRSLRTARPVGHLTRNIVHFGGQFAWFYGLAYLTLAQVTSLNATTSIFGVILAVLFLGERMTLDRFLVILAGFAGALIVLRPGVIPVEFASFVVLGGAFCYAAAIVMVKSLTSTETPLRIVFWMMAIQTPLSLLLFLPDWAWPSLADLPWIVVVGFAGVAAHYTMTRALTLADASVLMPINYLQLPIMAIIGAISYGEPPDAYTLGGGAIILAATWFNVWRSERARKASRRKAMAEA